MSRPHRQRVLMLAALAATLLALPASAAEPVPVSQSGATSATVIWTPSTWIASPRTVVRPANSLCQLRRLMTTPPASGSCSSSASSGVTPATDITVDRSSMTTLFRVSRAAPSKSNASPWALSAR